MICCHHHIKRVLLYVIKEVKMNQFSNKEINETLRILFACIDRCQKSQAKLLKQTPQYSLLENRIYALNIAKAILNDDISSYQFDIEELQKAIIPITSIIDKCDKAMIKLANRKSYYIRFENMYKAMMIARASIENEVNTRLRSNRKFEEKGLI